MTITNETNETDVGHGLTTAQPVTQPVKTAEVIPASTAGSAIDLASMIGVSPPRITKWRNRGAPKGLSYPEWIDWLRSAGKHDHATRLVHRLLGLSERPQAPANGSAAPPATAAGEAVCWREELAKERVLTERLKRRELERDLVPRERVEVGLGRAADVLLGALERGLWDRISASLDGLSPERIARLRRDLAEAQAALRVAVLPQVRDIIQEAVR